MEIIPIKTQRALSPTQIDLADYVLNPYRGCQIACDYCYARSNKSIQKENRTWGEYVYVKENFMEVLDKELGALDVKPRRVLIGSITEVFQPVEKQYELTASILRRLKKDNIPLVILTKSADIGSWASELNYSEHNHVYITINVSFIAENLEKRSHKYARRLEAAKELTRAGVKVILYVSPVIPNITDYKDLFEKAQGKAPALYFESYNPKLGQWDQVKKKLEPESLKIIERVYSSEENYKNYWESWKEQVVEYNKAYSLELDFFIYPFDSYYNMD